MTELLKNIKITDDNANYVVENVYDVLLQLIRAKLYLDGYQTTGEGAHEAEISYLQKYSFEQKDIYFLDRLRYFRNGIKYYGKRFDSDYANDCIDFMKKIKQRLMELTNL